MDNLLVGYIYSRNFGNNEKESVTIILSDIDPDTAIKTLCTCIPGLILKLYVVCSFYARFFPYNRWNGTRSSNRQWTEQRLWLLLFNANSAILQLYHCESFRVATINYLTFTEYLHYKLSQMSSLCRNHNPVFFIIQDLSPGSDYPFGILKLFL
jgi:hypothetical protein